MTSTEKASGRLRIPRDPANDYTHEMAAKRREFVREQKIARVGEPEDVAGLVAFVVGPEGRLLQGALIDMDAGATKTI